MKSQLNLVVVPGDTEISLFRKMSIILSSSYHVSFVEEIHARLVQYTSVAISADAVRELGDLWIIAYSPTQGVAKMTFLQAKYLRRNLALRGRFRADFFQYELLATRPALVNGGTFNFPSDILSFSCCDSVGSYGVFYKNSSKEIDFAYCSAALLTATSPSPTSYGKFNVRVEFPTATQSVNDCHCHVCSELNYTYDIDDFTQNLLQLNIGVDIHHYPHILAYLQSFLPRARNADTAVNGLAAFLNGTPNRPHDGFNGDDFNDDEPLPGHMLIINVDPKENKR